MLTGFGAVAVLGFYVGQVTAEPKLVTPDEVNSVQVYQRAINAVVTIIAKLSPDATQPGENPIGISSGFFYRPNLVVTNYHAVEGATENVVVQLRSGKSFPAKIFALDPGIDIALIKLEGFQSPHTLKFGEAKGLLPGQKVLAIGSPSGKSGTLTTGAVGSFNRIDEFTDDIGTEIPEMILTDANIQLGNSGGPLMDSKGLVVGVVDANLGSAVAAGGSIGLAIPANLVAEAVTDLEKFGVPQRGQLGASLKDLKELEPIVLSQSGLKSPQGVMVAGTEPGKAAAKAGLRPARFDREGKLEALGDIILKVDNSIVEDRFRVTQEIAKRRPGQTVSLLLWRNKQAVRVKITIVARTP